MKRSEMLQIILPYVHTDSPKGELYTAKVLLHKLEDAGMLPPSINSGEWNPEFESYRWEDE